MPNLEQIAEQFNKREAALKRRIIICGGTGCIANGSMKVRDALVEELKKVGENVVVELSSGCAESQTELNTLTYVSKSGCQGFCQQGPLMRIERLEFFIVTSKRKTFLKSLKRQFLKVKLLTGSFTNIR